MRLRHLLAILGVSLSASRFPAIANTAVGQDTVPGQQWISVTVEGSGPDVVLIPGLASSPKVWDTLAATLAKTHRLHRIQIAGFAGLAPATGSAGTVAAPTAQAIADYLRSKDIRTPAVIGHSLGGEVALMLAARHPEQVGRLMIVDALPFYSLLFDPLATSAGMRPRADMIRKAMLAAPREQAEASQAAAIAVLVKTEAARPAVVQAGRQSDPLTVANATHELMITDLRPELAQVKAPATVVYAYDTTFGIPPATVDAIYENAYRGLRNARFKRIDDSFHFIMLDQPENFERAVAGFLAAQP